jgi:uncharacterized alkaline shock family protein YloU
MSGPELTVTRTVVVQMVRLAAEEVPGVLRLGRGGPAWRAWLAGPPVAVRLLDGTTDVHVTLIARPGHALPALTGQVQSAIAAAVERLLGLQAGIVTVVVDGVGV